MNKRERNSASTSSAWINPAHILPRRTLLQGATAGIGLAALVHLLKFDGKLAASDGSVVNGGTSHFIPRAKRVIFLFMHGGVSQVDSFDYKPELANRNGQDIPFEPNPLLDSKSKKIMVSPWKFKQYGEGGHWVSDLFPHVAQHADRLCFMHSLHTNGVSHGQAVSMLHTGTDNLVRPSMGAWVSYGLGAENQNLPAFISILPARGHGGPRNYGSAFLPQYCQATSIGHSEMKFDDAKIAYLQTKQSKELQRRELDYIQEWNRKFVERTGDEEIVEGVIQSYEMAYRMQEVAPSLMDLSGESESTHQLYGANEAATANFGKACILARRFAEAGVRYIQVSCPQGTWDQHGDLKNGHEKNARAVDKPIAGLLTDLQQRGLLEDTLVVWAGEFGRTPIVQGSDGRDHNPDGFTVWLCGGGAKPGFHYGATDEFGYHAVTDRVHMHDFHATLLAFLGIDHTKLTYRHAGRDFRLTDIYGRVVSDVMS